MANDILTRNHKNPNYDFVNDVLNEIGDPTHSKPILDEIRPTLPDLPTPKPEEIKPVITPSPDNSSTKPNPNQSEQQKPSPSPSPSPSTGLTDEQIRKLARYDKLSVDKLPDDWQNNQKPFDLPLTWREELSQINDLKKRPTQEQLNNAVLKEADKYKDYEAIKKNLETWIDLFGKETAQDIKDKLDAKQPTLTEEEKEAIKNYSKLKKDYGELKTKNDKEVNKLKNEIKIKNAEIDKLKGWKNQPSPDSLLDQINQKIIQAYNSTDYLNGYYEKLMKTFLNWETAGTIEQRDAAIKAKININKCLDFLENVAKIKNPLITNI